MRVLKLTIDEENEFEGIDAVALVAEPAIELDFQYFSSQKFETYNDYPKAAIAAAKQGIKRNKANKNKCATQVGKVRAQQIANGENLSLKTIKRMRSFLLRQKDNYDLAVKRSDYDACGYISYLLWGGPSMIGWSTKKLRMAGELEDNNKDIIMAEMGRFNSIKEIDGIPVFVDEEPAEEIAKNIGCKGTHKHEVGGITYYMPCESHTEATDKMLEKVALKSVNKTAEDNVADGWVEVTEDEFNNSLYAELSVLQDASQFKTYKLNGITKFFKKENINEVDEDIVKGQFKFKAVKDKYELAGPLMVPEKLISRVDENGEKYMVFFDAEGIKKLSYKLMKNKLIDSVNIEHDPNKSVSDLTLVESWLVTDPKNDKSNSYGYDLPKGSWFGIYKVNSKEIWDKYIKTEAVKGFSVEGIFADKTIIASKEYEYATS